jgi:hypothetical protein
MNSTSEQVKECREREKTENYDGDEEEYRCHMGKAGEPLCTNEPVFSDPDPHNFGSHGLVSSSRGASAYK